MINNKNLENKSIFLSRIEYFESLLKHIEGVSQDCFFVDLVKVKDSDIKNLNKNINKLEKLKAKITYQK